MKSILFAMLIIALLPWGGSLSGQNTPAPAAIAEGKKIFVSQCAKCHDEDGSKKLPDGTTLLLRLSGNKDPEMRLGTRLKKEEERRQVFLYLQPLMERVRAVLKEPKKL